MLLSFDVNSSNIMNIAKNWDINQKYNLSAMKQD